MSTGPATGSSLRSNPAARVFVASVLGLFLELALIRWVSSEIRIFAYCKNLVLIGCFLGFGTGCLLHNRPLQLLRSLILLLLLLLLIQVTWEPVAKYGPRHITQVLAAMPGLMVFHAVGNAFSWAQLPGLLFAIGWSTVLFFVLAFIMIPWGQIIAGSIAEIPNPLRGYSVNVAGSLAGILAYTLATSIALPPAVWFAPVSLACILFEEKYTKAVLMLTLVTIAVMIPNQMSWNGVYWSSYQKLQVIENQIIVNNIGYQSVDVVPQLAKQPGPLNRFTLPYLVRRPPGRVLIIGAGAGNDAAVALGAGADSITAVEIDPMIIEIGRDLHPQKPYDSAKVVVVIDDARHFLKVNKEAFDLIVFSHVDSHTTLSSYTNVRLDDYLYTVESLSEARKHLAPDGFLYLSYWVEQPYVGARLHENCKRAFGHPPVTILKELQVGDTPVTLAHFLTAESEIMPRLKKITASWRGLASNVYKEGTEVAPSTDSWPFLALSTPHIPRLVLLLSFIVLMLCGLFVWKTRPPGEPFVGRVFWLGAAFLLVEVHNVSRLALCFGTTWKVNAWTIGAILGIILLSNFTYQLLNSRNLYSGKWIAVALFASLAAAYFIPLDRFLAYPHLIGRAGATLVLTIPIYFAGLLFADAFTGSQVPSFALGWNVLGAAVGGMSESLSYVFGIPVLIVVAACFYALALFCRRQTRH